MLTSRKIQFIFGCCISFISFTFSTGAFAQDGLSNRCEDTRTPLPPNAQLSWSDDGNTLRAVSGGTATTYTCDCKVTAEQQGECAPSLTASGDDVVCVGMCSACERKESVKSPGPVRERLERRESLASNDNNAPDTPGQIVRSCSDYSPEAAAELETRLLEVEDDLQRNGFGGLIHTSSDEVEAPAGWTLRVERVGDREIVVPTQEGTVTDTDAAASERGMGGKAKCKCQSPSGKCYWAGLVCQSSAWPNTCSSCGIKLRKRHR